MEVIGIRELKQNASAAVARAAAGETLVVTDRGRPVAQLTPLPTARLDQLVAAGLARPAKGDIRELGPPKPIPGASATLLSDALQAMRDEDER